MIGVFIWFHFFLQLQIFYILNIIATFDQKVLIIMKLIKSFRRSLFLLFFIHINRLCTKLCSIGHMLSLEVFNYFFDQVHVIKRIEVYIGICKNGNILLLLLSFLCFLLDNIYRLVIHKYVFDLCQILFILSALSLKTSWNIDQMDVWLWIEHKLDFFWIDIHFYEWLVYRINKFEVSSSHQEIYLEIEVFKHLLSFWLITIIKPPWKLLYKKHIYLCDLKMIRTISFLFLNSLSFKLIGNNKVTSIEYPSFCQLIHMFLLSNLIRIKNGKHKLWWIKLNLHFEVTLNLVLSLKNMLKWKSFS